MCEETNVGTYVHSTNGGCFSGGIPFVQCELVAPLVVDGSPNSKSSCSVGLMVSQVVASFAIAVRSWY